MVCAQKGYPLVVTMAESFSVERRKLMRFLGAKVVLTPASEKGTGMVKKARELAETHGWFLARQFENPANPEIHANTTAVEIIEDFGPNGLDYFVTGFGTGGTLTGVSRRLRPDSPETRIIAVEPENAMLLNNAHVQPLRRRWQCCSRASRVATASDAGLEPGFHSACGAGGFDAPSA